MFNIATPTHIEGIPSPFFIILNLTVLLIGSSGRLPRAPVLLPKIK
jgi:hypothetical protein